MAVIVETLMAEDLELGAGTTSKTHPAGGTLNGHQISLSTFSLVGAGGVAVTTSWTTEEVAINGCRYVRVAVPGATEGDKVLASFPVGQDLLLLSAQVSAANEVTVILGNLTGIPVPSITGTLSILVFRHR